MDKVQLLWSNCKLLLLCALFLQLLRTTAVNPHCAVQELAVISSRVFESVGEQIADFAAHFLLPKALLSASALAETVSTRNFL